MRVFNFDETIARSGTGCVKWDEQPPYPSAESAASDSSNYSPPLQGRAVDESLIPLWVADMDFAVAPAIQEAVRRRAAHPVFGYTHVGDDYYEAVISWFQRRHQWTIERDWIQYTTGVVPALSVIIKAFTQPGDKIILQTPVYNCFFSSVRNNGCEMVANVLLCKDGVHYEMDYDDLEQKAADERAKLLILCNPHNPVGRVWTTEELQRMACICQRYGVIVVCDEIHNELTFQGRRYTPFGTIDMDNAIVCTSPSKSFNTAGLQIANIICKHADWRVKIDRAININEVCDVNPFGVEALKAAYNESEEWLDSLCQYLWNNYAMLCDYVASNIPLWRVMPLEGTYLAWIDITATGYTSDDYADHLLREARVRVNPGTMYGHQSGKGYIRLNLACPRKVLMEALERIRLAQQ